MAVYYPDAIGEHIDAQERYFTGGLQYAGYFSPSAIAPGQVAHLYLFLQNVLNIPMTASIKINPPQTGFLRGSKPLLEIGESEIETQLGAAEAGLLTIPVTATGHGGDRTLALTLEVKTATKDKGDRVRPAKSQSKLDSTLIDSPVGLNLISSLGATYTEKPAKKASFELDVAGQAQTSGQTPSLDHTYEKFWSRQDAKFFNKAAQEINQRQVKLKKDLTLEALYANLYGESVAKFADAGLGLRIGEAIILAKILTYNCQYFLSKPDLTNGLLLPIWERAFAIEADTTDGLGLIRTVGYHHLLRVSVALSFGLIGQAFGRHFWSLEERQGVANHVADAIETGDSLVLDFLYLPLLIAGTQISNKLKLKGEDTSQTLALIYTARQSRKELFVDEDMAQVNKIYDRILQKVSA
jgi:hypothetical protein